MSPPGGSTPRQHTGRGASDFEDEGQADVVDPEYDATYGCLFRLQPVQTTFR